MIGPCQKEERNSLNFLTPPQNHQLGVVGTVVFLPEFHHLLPSINAHFLRPISEGVQIPSPKLGEGVLGVGGGLDQLKDPPKIRLQISSIL